MWNSPVLLLILLMLDSNTLNVFSVADALVGFKGHKVEALPIDEVLGIMEERGHFIEK